MELIKLILTKFTEEAINISILVLLITMCAIVATWLYYRKKFRELKHEIPASIVKDYLDAIIQNSTSLKSQLFRGGGLDVGDGVPSVMPLNRLTGSSIGISGSGEDVSQKNAEISMLRNMVTEKERMRQELEEKLTEMQELLEGNSGAEEVQILKEEIETLRAELEAALKKGASSASAGKGDAETLKQLQVVTKERDELKERLMEYEIIEEDLANLKRLQQENEQLKKSLAAFQKGDNAGAATAMAAVAAAPVAAAAVEEATETEIAELPKEEPITAAPAAEPEDDLEAAMAAALRGEEPKMEEAQPDIAALEEPKASGDENEKSAEELLSEFEKMLD